MLRLVGIVVLALMFAGSVHAQLGKTAQKKGTPDARIQRLLDENKIKYTIDDDGDFRCIVGTDSNRTQLVWIVSQTSKYLQLEIREVVSAALKTNKPLPEKLMQWMLTDNNQKKFGAWAIQQEGDVTAILFKIHIAADADFETLAHALLAAAYTADALEKEITQRDDY